MSELLGQIALAFLVTFLLSRLALWALEKWDGGMRKLALIHVVALFLAWTLYTLGSGDGHSLNWNGDILSICLVPQIIWFGVDIMLGKARRNAF